MDAVTLLNNHVKIEELLDYYGFDVNTNDGTIIRSCCKIHGGNNPNNFVANTENNLWYCHSNCGGGDAYTLVELMEGVSFYDAAKWLARFYKVDITSLSIIENKPNYKKELNKWLNLMRKRKTIFTPYHLDVPTRDIKRYRNFNQNTIDFFGLKYIPSIEIMKRNGEKHTLTNRLGFSLTFDGITIGISLRRTRSSDVPKWLHQPVNLNVGSILYNYDNVKTSQMIVISEGIKDVWAWHEINIPAVCTFGAHITKEQYKLLLKTGADLVFAFDGDDSGKKATIKAIKMFKNKANMYTIAFESNEDPENIKREELQKRFDSRNKL